MPGTGPSPKTRSFDLPDHSTVLIAATFRRENVIGNNILRPNLGRGSKQLICLLGIQQKIIVLSGPSHAEAV
jgi:hypothetical protein